MQYSTISKYFIYIFVLFAFTACSIFSNSRDTSTSNEAKGTAAKSEKNLQSNICKGKIDNTGARKLIDFIAQPTAFFCNMANKQLLALEHQNRALGHLDKEVQAKQAREKIANGTYGPGIVSATLVSQTSSEEDKAKELKYLADDADGSKKREMEIARSMMIDANKELSLGLASISIQVVNAYKTAKRASKDGDTFEKAMAVAQVAKVMSDVAQISSLSGGIKQANEQWEINNKHLEKLAGYENYASAGDKPDFKFSTKESDE